MLELQIQQQKTFDLVQVVDVEKVGEALANAKVVVEVVRDIEELDDVVLL